jgi:ketosteroid isomerase-like protein
MSEEKMEGLIRGFVEAFAKGDVEKTLSFLAEDAVWVAPEGTFRGKEEVRRLVSWSAQSSTHCASSRLMATIAGMPDLLKR